MADDTRVTQSRSRFACRRASGRACCRSARACIVVGATRSPPSDAVRSTRSVETDVGGAEDVSAPAARPPGRSTSPTCASQRSTRSPSLRRPCAHRGVDPRRRQRSSAATSTPTCEARGGSRQADDATSTPRPGARPHRQVSAVTSSADAQSTQPATATDHRRASSPPAATQGIAGIAPCRASAAAALDNCGVGVARDPRGVRSARAPGRASRQRVVRHDRRRGHRHRRPRNASTPPWTHVMADASQTRCTWSPPATRATTTTTCTRSTVQLRTPEPGLRRRVPTARSTVAVDEHQLRRATVGRPVRARRRDSSTSATTTVRERRTRPLDRHVDVRGVRRRRGGAAVCAQGASRRAPRRRPAIGPDGRRTSREHVARRSTSRSGRVAAAVPMRSPTAAGRDGSRDRDHDGIYDVPSRRLRRPAPTAAPTPRRRRPPVPTVDADAGARRQPVPQLRTLTAKAARAARAGRPCKKSAVASKLAPDRAREGEPARRPPGAAGKGRCRWSRVLTQDARRRHPRSVGRRSAASAAGACRRAATA